MDRCSRCGATFGRAGRFCGACGAGSDAETDRAVGAALEAHLDASTIDFFTVHARCLLRLEIVNSGGRPLAAVDVRARVAEQAALVAKTGPLAPGAREVVALWLVPSVAGFQELSLVLRARSDAGDASFFRATGIVFRVAAADGTRVSIVNIDQRSAHVVDNTGAAFAARETGSGLVGAAVWRRVPLVAITREEEAGSADELACFENRDPRTDGKPTCQFGTRVGLPRREFPKTRHAPCPPAASFSVTTARATYALDTPLAQGDLATLYRGERTLDGARVVVKIADSPADDDLMQAEVRALRRLASTPSPQQKHLPAVLDTFHIADGRAATVLDALDGLDLTAIRARLPDGIPQVHLPWLLRRCLSVLGFAHARGVLHGNLDPAHIVVRARDHNVWLVDWCWSITDPRTSGDGFRAYNAVFSAPEVRAKKAPLPSADLYALGKCAIYAAGGDPRTGEPPAHLDERLARFIRGLLVESAIGRPQDAWSLYAHLDKLREELYGPHRFVEMIVPENRTTISPA
jgi:hypothetical protein